MTVFVNVMTNVKNCMTRFNELLPSECGIFRRSHLLLPLLSFLTNQTFFPLGGILVLFLSIFRLVKNDKSALDL